MLAALECLQASEQRARRERRLEDGYRVDVVGLGTRGIHRRGDEVA